MYVIKRNKNKEPVRFDKITNRLARLCDPDLDIDPVVVTQKLSSRVHNGISTVELDTLSATICIAMSIDTPEFATLAARVVISNHHKNTCESFLETMNLLYSNKDSNGNPAPLVSESLVNLARSYELDINNMIDYKRDFLLDFFGFKTLERSYLLKIRDGDGKKVVERPQHLFMRVALGIWGEDMTKVKKFYENISLKNYTHATPTLFNSGTEINQLSSCYLTMVEDSIEGIFETYSDCGLISKWAGGVGCDISDIRSRGSYIKTTGGTSDGIMPLMKTFNSIARQFNQGGKRLGSFAMYLSVYHADIFEFLNAKKNQGADEDRARDLFYGLWIPDLFMRKIQEKDSDWYLMDPSRSPGLQEVYGQEFEDLYNKYVAEKRYVKVIKARELWTAIIHAQIELGMPYMLFKDACNRKSNQKNIGVVRSSNLCTEIIEVTTPKETSVCNLASICLPQMLIPNTEYKDNVLEVYSKDDCAYCKLLKSLLKKAGIAIHEISSETAKRYLDNSPSEWAKKYDTVPQVFRRDVDGVAFIGGFSETWKMMLRPRVDHEKLYAMAYELTENLNRVIDTTYYPIEKTQTSNLRHRPIGIGVQGLADVFLAMKLPFDSDEARIINKDIFETIYFGAMSASCDLATKFWPYSSFRGSPLSEGKFQFDLWLCDDLSGVWDWDSLRERVMKYGVRNSLLIALMPTASTSQIMGSVVECFEPLSSNMYVRRTLAGEFTVINPYLINDLISLGIWNSETKNRLQYDRGSAQNIVGLPHELKMVYRTAYEIPQKSLITMSAERAPFVCQSQSLNLFFDKPEFNKLTSAHVYSWKSGLKTGSYYIRTKPAASAQRFGMDIETEKQLDECVNCSA